MQILKIGINVIDKKTVRLSLIAKADDGSYLVADTKAVPLEEAHGRLHGMVAGLYTLKTASNKKLESSN